VTRNAPGHLRGLLLVGLASLMLVSIQAHGANAESITATVDSQVLLPGDTLTYTITVQNASGEIKPPNFKSDFRQLSRRSSRKNMFGERSQSWVYTLRPKRMGELTIAPAKLVRRGQVVRQTKNFTIRVMGEDQLSSEPPQISITSERVRLNLEESLQLKIQVKMGNLGSGVELGDDWAKGFQLVEESQREEGSVAKDNEGKLIQVRNLTLTLRPERVGRFQIGPVPLISNGKILAKSNLIRLEVIPPPPITAEEARNMSWYDGRSLALRAYTEKDDYFVSEPFLIRWELIEGRRGVRGRISLGTDPSLEGFSARSIDLPEERTRTYLGGRKVTTQPVSTKMARAFKAGSRTIDPMVLKVTDTFTGDTVNRIASKPFKMRIKPLPLKGQPAGFEAGHVGRFQTTVEWPLREGDTLSTHQKIQLRVVVEGEGNLEGLVAPNLETSKDVFEVEDFSDRVSDTVIIDADGVRGHRVFRYRITALTPGSHPFPTLVFNYFDPKTEAYVRVKEAGPAVEVTGSPVLETASGLGYANQDIGPILESESFENMESGDFTDAPLFWILLLAPFGLFVLLEGFHRYQVEVAKDPAAKRFRSAHASARKRLMTAEGSLKKGHSKEFFDHISSTLESCLSERLSIPAQGLQHQELKRKAVHLGVAPELMEDIVAELENCDFARFASSASMSDAMSATLTRTSHLVERLVASNTRRSRG
jgi:hypothetical protein